jgi:multiple sugar transport system permease protein
MLGWPLLQSLWLSLNSYLLGTQPKFVGLANYVSVLKDPNYGKVITNTLTFTGSSVAVKVVIGMAVALLLNAEFRGRNFFRALFLIPWVMPGVAAFLALRWFYDYSNGMVNLILTKVGLIGDNIAWLSVPSTAMIALILANVWKGFPFYGISFLAGLQTIPRELYEASRIDGAGAVTSFIHVTVPGILRVMGVTVMLSTIWTFNEFSAVYVLTQGGPGYATMTIAPFTYNIGVRNYDLARAVVMSLLVVPILVAVIWAVSKFMLEKET